MAKAASPVRLEKELMQSAKSVGERFHRSAAEQVEYWADLGRSVSKVLDPDVLLKISAGLSRVKVEPVVSPVVDPDSLFDSLEQDRQRGTLAAAVTGSSVRYQISVDCPGLLERISADGEISVGQFSGGTFVAAPESDLTE